MLKNVKQKGHVIPITQALANSALIMGLDDKCTAICPGHVLYGLSSITEPPASMNEFLPVLTSVKSRVIHVADHRDGPSPGSGGYHRIALYRERVLCHLAYMMETHLLKKKNDP